MGIIAASPLLHVLRSKRLLDDRLRWLGVRDPEVARWLHELDKGGSQPEGPTPTEPILETLREYAIIHCGDTGSWGSSLDKRCRKPALTFVRAMNFELTYDCNYDCSHCLQQGIRRRKAGRWIPTDACQRALQDAWFAGFLTTGVNFTGGEPFLPSTNLPELVEAARSLQVDVRINTNGWWGKQDQVRLGNRTFASPGHVIGWLRETGVAMLAMSVDGRYDERPDAWKPVLAIVRECERQRQPYQFVYTGTVQCALEMRCRRLLDESGIAANRFVPMELIDLGGAAGQTGDALRIDDIASVVQVSPCEGRNFFRPTFLHVSPEGGVRTCMYAPGGGWCGNICRESLLSLTARFACNPVTTVFAANDVAGLTHQIIKPYASVYGAVNHPCAASVLVARAIEHCCGKDTPLETTLRPVHERIASELNVRRMDGNRR